MASVHEGSGAKHIPNMTENKDEDTNKRKTRRNFAPTIQEIHSDVITQLANQYWAPHSTEEKKPFNEKIIERIYYKEIGHKFPMRRIMLLEFSQYLELYLWPNFTAARISPAYVMSIVMMINEKFRQKVPVWKVFKEKPTQVALFFHAAKEALKDINEQFSLKEQTVLLVFLIHCFNSLEEDVVRQHIQHTVSLGIWKCLLPSRLNDLLKHNPRLNKRWGNLEKKEKKLGARDRNLRENDYHFLHKMIHKYLAVLEEIPAEGFVTMEEVHFCERFLELCVDLQAQLPTRRFFNTLLLDSQLLVYSTQSNLYQREQEGHLFFQLLNMVRFYTKFEIDDLEGTALDETDMLTAHYDQVLNLQKQCFAHFPELEELALANISQVDNRDSLMTYLKCLNNKRLHDLAAHLHLLEPHGEVKYKSSFILEVLVSHHEKRISQMDEINSMPLYPTEEVLWDENIVPNEYFSGEGCLALPKLNLQFLTLHDYLLRNFNLFRLETMYEIRQDVEDAVLRLSPFIASDQSTQFSGWARMALPIAKFAIVEVAKPHVGESHPSRVRADVTINIDIRNKISTEWDSLRKHDVCFLLTIDALSTSPRYSPKKPFLEQVRLRNIRGCEVEGYLDEDGRVVMEGFEKPKYKNKMRTVRVYLDVNQYQADMEKTIKGGYDVYETFSVIMRRKPKENNFKAVLETIRDMMNTECVVPSWLHDIFLGYGDPSNAHYSNMPDNTKTIDFNDTFLNSDHLMETFIGYEIKCDVGPEKQVKPFKITFSDKAANIEVVPYTRLNPGPYPYNKPKENVVKFTPTQVEAIKAGCNPGLTMVVGPPGTGKTDVAVQIINNIYHNFPHQRTLIVTHSNQALNQLFQKIMGLDIDERHLLRLGHGEEGLGTDKDFSKYGRVNYILAHRLELLEEVGRLQQSLGVSGEVTYTCETAGYFNLYQIKSRWEEFKRQLKKQGGAEGGNGPGDVKEYFPFHVYFSNAPQPVFKGESFEEDLDVAEGCYRHIQRIFGELEEFRAFELMRSGLDRANYLLVKEAKIIAMTCTHAALTRRNLVKLGFRYDNILMEEAAQILEIETFIPLLLQEPEDGHNRLKRVVLIGDHHQLPPVIKNMAFQKYSNMEQSLFTRFIRLGVPAIELDKQGRSRESLANLYNWRYKKLGNLPHVLESPEYLTANPGFTFDFQLINVEDFNGVGESEPNPYFYQNLSEAEYVVAVYMYMRLLGYPGEKITILTTYNGQKHLIRDVVKQRCGDNPVFGFPNTITTVDRYQGSQNDYILLSLVRTKAVGHLRDVRRLIVAMSRARLGLYVFARVGVFANCYELTPAFNQLLLHPTDLHLCPDELFPTNRKAGDLPPKGRIIKNMPEMSKFVYDFYYDVIERLMKEQERDEARLKAEQKQQKKEIEKPAEEDAEVAEKNMKEMLSQPFLSFDQPTDIHDDSESDEEDDQGAESGRAIKIIALPQGDPQEFEPFPHVKYEEEENLEGSKKQDEETSDLQSSVSDMTISKVEKEKGVMEVVEGASDSQVIKDTDSKNTKDTDSKNTDSQDSIDSNKDEDDNFGPSLDELMS